MGALHHSEECLKVEKFSRYFCRPIKLVIFKNLLNKLEGVGVNVAERTKNPAESMNAKVKKTPKCSRANILTREYSS